MRAGLREQDSPRSGQGRSKFGAIEVASSTAGRAVFFSGLAVMISLGGLLLIDDDVFKSIAIGSIAVVLISVLGSLTFLPATLSILDRWVVRFGIPFLSRDRGEGRGIWGTIVRAATNKPVIAAVAAGGDPDRWSRCRSPSSSSAPPRATSRPCLTASKASGPGI